MSLKVTGVIVTFLDKQSGVSKKGSEWVKQSFVLDNNETYNNIFCFDVFGKEKVDGLGDFAIGDTVEVEFNVSCREYNGKYFTSLQAWRLVKIDVDEFVDNSEERNTVGDSFETISMDELAEDSDDSPF